MADAADIATEIDARAMDRGLAAASAPLPVGVPGDCQACDQFSPRLIGGRCAPCRDGKRR